MAILQDGRAFKSNGDVYLVVQGDEINISRLMASENSLSDAYDDAHHVPVEEVAAMLDIPVDSIFDFDAINIDAIVQDVLHHETSAIKIATERGYGMASHDGGRRWDRLIIRCGNANCPLNEPALAEFWMGEHGLERPKIFQYWVPGTGRHYQEYKYGVDACPGCKGDHPIALDKTLEVLDEIWDVLGDPVALEALHRKFSGVKIWDGSEHGLGLRKDLLPIFQQYDNSNGREQLADDVSQEEERAFQFSDILLLPKSAFRWLLNKGAA